MFDWLMTTTPLKRDLYILEVLLYRYLVAYIQKKEFDVDVLKNIANILFLLGIGSLYRIFDKFLEQHMEKFSGQSVEDRWINFLNWQERLKEDYDQDRTNRTSRTNLSVWF